MISILDIMFIVIILIFAIVATVKGFVKELFNKISWFLGILGAILLTKKLTPYMSSVIKNQFFSVLLSFLLIFIIIFLTVQIIKTLIGRVFEGEIMKGLDKSLGFLLGTIEGLLIVIMILLLLSSQMFFNVDSLLNNSIFYKIFSAFIPTSKPIIIKGVA